MEDFVDINGIKTSPKIDQIGKALFSVQSEVGPVYKDSVNPHYKSNYPSIDSVLKSIHGIMNYYGILVLQPIVGLDGDPVVNTTLMHPESGQWISCATKMPLAKKDPQAYGSAVTYGRRYSLISMLCLSSTEDDGGSTTNRPRVEVDDKNEVVSRIVNLAHALPEDCEHGTGQAYINGRVQAISESMGKKFNDMTELDINTLKQWEASLKKRI